MRATTLGQRIRELRMKKGFTQIELAKGICTPSMVSQCESDRARPSYKILVAFAEKLETKLESLLANINMNMEYTSQLKMAKSMVAANEFATAIPLLMELLEVPRYLISISETLLLLSECFVRTGKVEEAESLLKKQREQYMAEKDNHMLTVILKQFGLLEMEKKQYEVAVYHFEDALNELKKDEVYDPLVEAELYLNLGHAREKQGKLKQALDLYHQAQEIYKSAETPQQIAVVYADMARSYHRLNQPEKSIEYSECAYVLFCSTHDTYMGVKSQMISAVANGQQGHEEESIQVLDTVITKFQEMGKTKDVGIAYIELAKLQLAIDEIESAVESCRIARSLLPELHSHQAWVHRLLGEVEAKKGHHDEAIRLFYKAGDCFKLVGEIGEWATTMSELSRLRVMRNEFQEAYRIISEVQNQTQTALQERGIVL